MNMLSTSNMKLYLFFVVSFIVTSKFILGDECDKSGILIYEDLGCTPVYEDDKKCPSKYSCPLEYLDKHCLFRGRHFANREQVENSTTILVCEKGCACRGSGTKPTFACADFGCREWHHLPASPDCYRKYNFGECCSVGEVCPPFSDTTKCVFDGKEYREGEKFYPANTCLDCICQKGFKGKLEEPFCRRRQCGDQLKLRSPYDISESCAPFYTKKNNNGALCCPDSWYCRKRKIVIKGEAKSEETCKFKNLTMKVGQYFEKPELDYAKIRCDCLIPPFLTCIEA